MYNSGYQQEQQQQPYWGQQQRPMQASHPQQMQIGGLYPVRSEQEARNYPVAPGVVMVFINLNAPYCYTKAQREPMAQAEFRIFKDESYFPPLQPKEQPQAGPDVRQEMAAMEERINQRLAAFEEALSKKPARAKKEEDV